MAGTYNEHRPDYPAAALQWCVAPLRREINGLRVLDLGAGTGKLTALLAKLGADVTAVDPDESMMAVLRSQMPSVHALHGPAEEIPLPDGSVDAVLCGQSLHWFDLPRALPEIARVLTSGGVLAAMWNSDDDRVPWVAGLRDASEGVGAAPLSARRAEAAGTRIDEFGQLFLPAECAEFKNSFLRTADSLVVTMSTHSQLLVMPPAERDRLLGQVRAYLASQPETAEGEFELPIVTTIVRAVLRG